MLREKQGGKDQDKEEAYRRENYIIFQKNLAEAFNQYNKDGNDYLDRDEFKNFMTAKAKITGQEISEELLETIFMEMDVDGNGAIDV